MIFVHVNQKSAKLHVPVSAFADDFNLKVIYTTWRRNGMRCPYAGRVFVILSRTYNDIHKSRLNT